MAGWICLLGLLSAGVAGAQDAGGGSPQKEQSGGGGGWQQNGPRPLFGKITALTAGAMEIATPDGTTVKVNLTGETEFRKDREKAAAGDFKIGEMVMVRGAENGDHSVTAQSVATRSGGPGGAGGRTGGPGGPIGTMGKDYVAGEIKAIDAPKITVQRTDGMTQTIELTEETSLRHGRESVTMAEIQVGDHVMARGAEVNGAFVPKMVMVMGAEQWKRMQERGGPQGGGNAAQGQETPPTGSTTETAKPEEQPH